MRNVFNLFYAVFFFVMGLFSSKKKEIMKKEIPSVSELPAFDGSDVPHFPVYEPSFSDIKSEVSGVKDNSFDSSFDSSFEESSEIPIRKSKPVKKIQEIEEVRVKDDNHDFEEKSRVSGGKPLFVKIEKYKDALMCMDVLRKKISDAEEVLKEIDKIRIEEERALESWRKDLSKVKEKLVELDENLFEV